MKTKHRIVNLEQAEELRAILKTFLKKHPVLDDHVSSYVGNTVELLDSYITVYSDENWRFKRFYVSFFEPYMVWDKETNGNAWLTNPDMKSTYTHKAEAKVVVDRLNSIYPKPYEVRGGFVGGWRIIETATGLLSDEVYTSLESACEEECRLNGQVAEKED